MNEWKTIESAPKDGTAILLLDKPWPDSEWSPSPYVGQYREGYSPEPADGEFGWRAVCCGRFSSPKYWMPLPKLIIDKRSGELLNIK